MQIDAYKIRYNPNSCVVVQMQPQGVALVLINRTVFIHIIKHAINLIRHNIRVRIRQWSSGVKYLSTDGYPHSILNLYRQNLFF